MRRADRLFDILQHLRGGRLVTARRLAERLEVSERTIYRDIADLQSSGVPIDGEAGVGYLLRSGFELPPLMFTEDEIEAVAFGLRMAAAWGGARVAASASEALVKVEAVLPERLAKTLSDTKLYAVPGFALTAEDRARLDEVHAAINGRFRLDVVYDDQEGGRSERIIRPLALYYWGRVWTVAAWCELRSDFRSFRPDRFVSIARGNRFERERGRELPDFLRTVMPGAA
jgi:predicted DNA-binding transcriptional regulator YafY